MRELSRILTFDVRDPQVADVRVSRVELSSDKRHARVWVEFWDPGAAEDAGQRPLRALRRATPHIRRTLAKSLRMRHTPELRWEYDRSEQYRKRIETLLERIEKRKRKRPSGLGLVPLLLALSSAANAASLGTERLESSALIMGSEFRIACYAETKRLAAGAITAAFDEVRRIDGFLSNYRQDSELSTLNRRASANAVTVSGELARLLARCQDYAEASEGAFDITVGALVKAWGFHSGDGARPNAWTLWRARQKVGYRHLELDLQASQVRFLRAGLELDPGGIGKGYAVDRAVAILREYGVTSALVSSGTSSIFALGSPVSDEDGWPVNIRPAGEGRPARVKLRDQGLSTSGSYEKFFEAGGQSYGHVLDPRTGQPVRGLAAVSVIAATAIDAEAWSTALLVNGREWARRHRPRSMQVYVCAEGGSCGWLGDD